MAIPTAGTGVADVDLTEASSAALFGLLEASHFARPDDIPRLAMDAGNKIDAELTVVYLIDYEQRALVPLLPQSVSAQRDIVSLEGSLAGRAFTEVAVMDSRSGSQLTVWAPLLDGSERLGVVEFVFPLVRPVDDALRTACSRLASLIAELTVTRMSYGDATERTRRILPMSMPAEIQWNMRPPLTFATDRVVISGILAPCYTVAGDSFDYAVNGDVAHLAVFDAMGHGLEATILTTVALGTYRNARRCGLDLVDTVRSMDRWLSSYFGPDKFVTAVIGELDTQTGVWRWVTAGHPPALLMRRGRIVKTMEQFIEPPLGLLTDFPSVGEERLEPGDRLLLYTDGVTEARDSSGDFFGIERLADLVAREAASQRPAPEVLRRLNQAILSHQGGELQDDATTLFVEWLGQQPGHVRQ